MTQIRCVSSKKTAIICGASWTELVAESCDSKGKEAKQFIFAFMYFVMSSGYRGPLIKHLVLRILHAIWRGYLKSTQNTEQCAKL